MGPAIATGGMGAIHLARRLDADLPRVFAIKVIKEGLDEQQARMFLGEVRLSARIRSPFVSTTTDIVREGDRVGLVMDLIEGVSLHRLLQCAAGRAQTLPVQVIVAIFCDVLRGLHATHTATDDTGEGLDIVHRDVSPQNIMLGVDGLARLIDFGIAKGVATTSVTTTGEIKGKVGYMSPEQLQAAPVTRRSDLYAVGVCLWEALTQRRLRASDDLAVTLGEILFSEVPRVTDLAPDVPSGLQSVLDRALARTPADRYASAEAFLGELEEICAPATHGEVARHVMDLGAPALDQLADQLRALDESFAATAVGPIEHLRRSALDGGPSLDSARGGSAHRPSMRLPLFAFGFVGTAIIGGYALLRPSTPASSTAVADGPPAVEAPAAPRALVVQPLPSHDAVPSPDATNAKPPATKRAPHPRPRTGEAAPPAQSCSPPYFFDSAGQKHFRPECFDR